MFETNNDEIILQRNIIGIQEEQKKPIVIQE